MNVKWHRYKLGIISFLGSLLLSITFALPSLAHWADLAVAEVMVGPRQTQITLTFPTGLVASADDNRDGQLSAAEVRSHQAELEAFLGDRIRLTDGKHKGTLTVTPLDTIPSLKVTANTHTTLQLAYNWSQPIQALKMQYDLFLPEAPAARCLATIFNSGQTQNFIFSPQNKQISLMQGSWQAESFLIATFGSFVWGAMHALSPGHGKTIVGAYLVGARATAQQAVFLGLTTTITHTIGVFALGLVALFASQYILPEQLYPWLSCLSGLMVVAIGVNLFISRMRSAQLLKRSHLGHHAEQHQHHDHDHGHSHRTHSHLPPGADHHHNHHDHDHGHSHGTHSHLPPGADGSPVTWRSLLILGISGGLVPCPSALVVLLSSIALGQIGFGLVLVLAFSLGLAGVLTALGLLLVRARRLFERVPTQMRLVRVLPAVSALFIALLGLGITTQALMQIGLVKL